MVFYWPNNGFNGFDLELAITFIFLHVPCESISICYSTKYAKLSRTLDLGVLLHGGALKFEHSNIILSCNNATETCNTAMDRQFREISEFFNGPRKDKQSHVVIFISTLKYTVRRLNLNTPILF